MGPLTCRAQKTCATVSISNWTPSLSVRASAGYLLHRMRQQGFRVKLIEAVGDLGGIWHWSNGKAFCAPDLLLLSSEANHCKTPALVSTHHTPFIRFIPEVFRTWKWTDRYPGADELRA